MHFLQADFTVPEDVTRLCEEVGQIGFNALVNNAGINRVAPFLDLSEDDYDLVLEVNVRATYQLSRAVIPKMLEAGHGRICNVTSIWGMKSISGRAAYSTSKFALRGLTAAIAAEFAPHGILANCVAPGFIDTELTRTVLGVEGIQDISSRIPIKRLGTVQEIAELIAWLVSPSNSYMTGQTVTVDGGFLGA
jgi:NAD(P)-dependent dehydrogenase (short-subunit alcohol dehydrogenase family)